MAKETGLPEQSRYVFERQTGVLETLLPYCLQRQKDGRWLVLNRNYQPICHLNNDRTEVRTLFCLKGLGPKTRQKLCVHGSGGVIIHLYNGGCHPMDSRDNRDKYLKKLEILARFETREERY
ncbi:hypothetical protein [Rhodovulum sp. FJ3]|uniref:hypothetical protein n=1 Tax=Rhodovulum sp. FJ3 TaxID=3079053 RepID=UPI00293DD4A2|nr:hypothetical protein [Rhodovulum sp. FJ3]MDV4168230.1 hypothetical protein [Rhodovulum sp. FJ3]